MKAVIYDMDGTMVDNMMVHHEAWQRKLKACGLDLSMKEVMEKVHGVNEEILERLFGDKYSPEERRQISWEKEEEYREIFADRLALIDGLQTFMDELKTSNIPQAVASAAPPENVDFVLDKLSIRGYFSSILHSRDVTHGKPHPEIYLKSSSLMGFKPKECLVFEDSPTGAKSASAAGCPIMVVTTTHLPKEFDDIKGIVGFIDDFQQINTKSLQDKLK